MFSHGLHLYPCRGHAALRSYNLPRNTQNPQNLLLRNSPTDFTDAHRWLGCVEFNPFNPRLNSYSNKSALIRVKNHSKKILKNNKRMGVPHKNV